jgi:O-acetyl-ADP-ribose deacetylase (regulator of RNase III)
MIRDAHGDLLSADVDALVNTVNTVGVMGKGIALQFKKRFPGNFKAYAAACKAGDVETGRMFVFDAGQLVRPRWIVNFPTKRHWKSTSRLEDIDAGLDDLAKVIAELGIRSIAVPPLGCGLGGLRWTDVKPLIEAKLAGVDAEILVFGPEGSPAAAAIADASPRPAMSVGKAALVRLVERYAQSALGGAGLIEVQKLMYFLQTAGQPLRLNYVKGLYGPYADNLRHVLIKVEGHFLTGFGDGTGSVLDAEPIEVLPGAAEEADAVVSGHPELAERIDRVLQLSEGFESAYGMELLATVHWAATAEGCTDRACVVDTVHGWNQRKERLFTPSHINTALDHLVEHGWLDGGAFAA